MEEVFITLVEKQTVMCLCGVTGHSGHVDRMLRSVLPELQCLSCDRTRPVMIFPSLEPYWSRPDTGAQHPVTHLFSVRSHQTISP